MAWLRLCSEWTNSNHSVVAKKTWPDTFVSCFEGLFWTPKKVQQILHTVAMETLSEQWDQMQSGVVSRECGVLGTCWMLHWTSKPCFHCGTSQACSCSLIQCEENVNSSCVQRDRGVKRQQMALHEMHKGPIKTSVHLVRLRIRFCWLQHAPESWWVRLKSTCLPWVLQLVAQQGECWGEMDRHGLG